jgi:hypothetical protein
VLGEVCGAGRDDESAAVGWVHLPLLTYILLNFVPLVAVTSDPFSPKPHELGHLFHLSQINCIVLRLIFRVLRFAKVFGLDDIPEIIEYMRRRGRGLVRRTPCWAHPGNDVTAKVVKDSSHIDLVHDILIADQRAIVVAALPDHRRQIEVVGAPSQEVGASIFEWWLVPLHRTRVFPRPSRAAIV